MVLLWISFAIIVFMTGTHVEPERLAYADWKFLPIAVPIIITAFHFHNLIPHVIPNERHHIPIQGCDNHPADLPRPYRVAISIKELEERLVLAQV